MKITAELFPLSDLSVEDQKLFIDWIWKARSINCFDPDVLNSPRVIMAKASSSEEGSQLFIPLQATLMWESIAPRPGISERVEALSLARIEARVVSAMQDAGFGESYFLCKDDTLANFVAGRPNWEELQGYRILRRKLTPEEKTAWAH